MRRLLVIALVVPYCIVVRPRWIIRDFVIAFREGAKWSEASRRYK